MYFGYLVLQEVIVGERTVVDIKYEPPLGKPDYLCSEKVRGIVGVKLRKVTHTEGRIVIEMEVEDNAP